MGRRQQQAGRAPGGIARSGVGAVQHVRLRRRIAHRGDLDHRGFEVAIGWAKQYAAQIGRTAPLDICFSAGNLLEDSRSADERHAIIARLAAAGVTWLTIAPSGSDRSELIERSRAFAKEFITA